MVSELKQKIRDYRRMACGRAGPALGIPADPEGQRMQTLKLQGSLELDFGPEKVCTSVEIQVFESFQA
jgi:hypothetical protein